MLSETSLDPVIGRVITRSECHPPFSRVKRRTILVLIGEPGVAAAKTAIAEGLGAQRIARGDVP